MDLAWGCVTHSGWAVAVLTGGSAERPVVLDRRRLELCPPELPRIVFHAAQELPRSRAAALVARVDAAVADLAERALDAMATAAAADGHLVALGLVGSPREMPDLDAALSNHAALHRAEGELYRGALDDAAAAIGLPVVTAPPKRAIEEAAAALGCSRDHLAARLAGLRAELGAPWQADHKDATAAALLALHLAA